MKIIDGKNAVLGRLASYVAKEALKGEEIVILNCEQVIITGNKKNIKENFEAKRRRVGSSQKGPKYPKTSEKIVKRTVRGMLPNHRKGRGKEALRRVKCYTGIPEEFKDSKKIIGGKEKRTKYSQIKVFVKHG
jgi:large subunit ribosomal protein L13